MLACSRGSPAASSSRRGRATPLALGARRRPRRRCRCARPLLPTAAARQPRDGEAPTWTGCGTATTWWRLIAHGGAERRRARPAAPGLAPALRARCSARGARLRATPRCARAGANRRALRPRQRALRAVSRPDHDVLLRASSSAPRRHARGGLAGEARAHLRASSTSGPRDHVLEIGTRLGRLRAARRRTLRLPRDDHHDLARAARLRARAGRARRARATASRCCSRTTATCAGSYDKLVSIEMIEAVGWQYFGTLLPPLLGAAGSRRRDAAAGDHDRRPRLRGREGRHELHQHLHLPRRLPALAGGDLALARARRPTCGRSISRTSPPTTPTTLARWRERFRRRRRALRELGYDERFRRLWELYLSYCEGGFASGGSRTCSCCWPSPGPGSRHGRTKRALTTASSATSR